MRKKARRYSSTERDTVWSHWKQGQSLESIGKSLGRRPETVLYVLAKYGGVKHIKPKRAAMSLCLTDIEEISRGISAGLSFRSIARKLKRAPSTISREVKRHGGRQNYRAESADKAAWNNAKRPKACKLTYKPLQKLVTNKLLSDWSPQQIRIYLYTHRMI